MLLPIGDPIPLPAARSSLSNIPLRPPVIRHRTAAMRSIRSITPLELEPVVIPPLEVASLKSDNTNIEGEIR